MAPDRPSFAPLYVDDPGEPALFALRHRPAGPARARVLAFLPFAEEMNKCRRMVALGARALADAGAEVIVFDARGCGDSAGDFADATWDAWLDDAARVLRRFEASADRAPLWLWGLRAGALQACAFAGRLAAPPLTSSAATSTSAEPAGRLVDALAADRTANLLLWAPVASGKVHLQQFLRMKLAAGLTTPADGDGADAGGRAPGAMAALRRELDAAGAIDVAGYRLPRALAAGLDAARLAPPAGGRVVALDLSSRPDAEPAPAPSTLAFVQACRDAGLDAHARALRGPAFWQTVEIEEAPALVDATRAALEAWA